MSFRTTGTRNEAGSFRRRFPYRLGGMAAVLETRLRQAQAESMAPIDLIPCLISDELNRRGDRLLERRRKQAGFGDAIRTLDSFDCTFNAKMNRSLLFDLPPAPSRGYCIARDAGVRRRLAARFSEANLKKKLDQPECLIEFRIRGKRKGSAHFWTCDFTEDYIRINASYRT